MSELLSTWQFWLLFSMLVLLYGQHRKITTRRKALELATNQRWMGDRNSTIIGRADEFEYYIRNGKAKPKPPRGLRDPSDGEEQVER